MVRLLALLLLAAGPAAAIDLSLPTSAQMTVERNTNPDRYEAPVGVFAEGQVDKIALDGDVRRAAWRLAVPGLTSLQVIEPLRVQLVQAGFDIVLDCAASGCGGFDFRFNAEVLPGPNMHVNMRDYHFITGLRRVDGTAVEAITVLASATESAAYIQVIQAGQATGGALSVTPEADVPVTTQPVDADDLAGQLLTAGHVVLTDLDFGSGTSDLGPGPFGSLEQLAAFMTARSGARVALVGHTDTVGGLDANIALSRARARSVRQRMIDSYGIAATRLEAEGMGYLSPVASNLSEEGRNANRRVEAVLLSE